MKKSRKIILAVLLATVVAAGSIGGVALAADGEDSTAPQSRHPAMLEEVCRIYEENTGVAIDADQLQAAFDQAREDMLPTDIPNHRELDAEAMQEHLQALLDDGKITQEQYDELIAWLGTMPDDVKSDEYKEWLDDRPEIDIPFGPGGERSMKGGPGMGGPNGFPGGEAPQPPEDTATE